MILENYYAKYAYDICMSFICTVYIMANKLNLLKQFW